MASGSISWDDQDFLHNLSAFGDRLKAAVFTATGKVADELLRLSQIEVPHDKGTLQNSGSAQPDPEDETAHIVGYNTVYAAHLHEHPEYHFQAGRKGKYLEDPMKKNNNTFLNFMGESVKGVME